MPLIVHNCLFQPFVQERWGFFGRQPNAVFYDLRAIFELLDGHTCVHALI